MIESTVVGHSRMYSLKTTPVECEIHIPNTPTQTWAPLNSLISDATGNVQYVRPGLGHISEPTPFAQGGWHFPTLGSGGSPDYPGACVASIVRWAIVGDGTLVIPTGSGSLSGITLRTRLTHSAIGFPDVLDEDQFGSPGVTFTVDISSHDRQFCIHIVEVESVAGPCGGTAWAYSGSSWTKEGDVPGPPPPSSVSLLRLHGVVSGTSP